MPNFVYDSTSLYYPKTNFAPLPAGADSTKWVSETDWNTAMQAIVDVRGVLLGGRFLGFETQASDPLPSNSDQYLWMSTAGRVKVHMPDDTTTELATLTDVAAAGGGWTDAGGLVRLTTTADTVVIGATAMTGSEKLRVVGDAIIEGDITLDDGQILGADSSVTGSGLVLLEPARNAKPSGWYSFQFTGLAITAHVDVARGFGMLPPNVEYASVSDGSTSSYLGAVIGLSELSGTSALSISRATTLYVQGPPTAGTNMTLNDPYAVWVDAGTTRLDGDIFLTEMSAPSTPAANSARLYLQDNGVSSPGNKTQLIIKWSDGTTTTIAESPAS